MDLDPFDWRTLELLTPVKEAILATSTYYVGRRMRFGRPSTDPLGENASMDVAQLIGRYLRIRQELAEVFVSRPLQRERAERLAADLRETRRALTVARAADEQTGDSLSFAASAFLLPPSEFSDGDEWLGTI